MQHFDSYLAYGQSKLCGLMRNERGASLVEYALLLALISVVCIAAITLIGGNANTKLSTSGSALQ